MQVRVTTLGNGVKVFNNAATPTVGVKEHLCIPHIQGGVQKYEIINATSWKSYTLIRGAS
jgi:hypothetical protein